MPGFCLEGGLGLEGEDHVILLSDDNEVGGVMDVVLITEGCFKS